MSRVHSLDRFVDARGWSINDIFGEVRELVMNSGLEAACPNDAIMNPDNFQFNYSILYPGIIKAWHRHKNQDDFFCVLKGNAQFGIFSETPNGEGRLPAPEKHIIGELNPAVVHIKAGEWHGLTAIGDEPVGLLYLVTNLYDPNNPDEERAGWENFGPSGFWFPENK